MYKVQAESLEAYFAFDPARQGDLKAFDAAVGQHAPDLKRWFYAGAKAGEAGMQFKMIGYGITEYREIAGTEWPIVGVALQKNYISVYLAIAMPDASLITEAYRGKLGESRMGQNNFSFETFGQLNQEAVAALLKAVAELAAV
ncbi:hypothetical protein [Niveibacterium sp.]|uniref:hypothetical protein n=1 Tax=Niveibacterium sp. TaxID=2017444 RepID=UPI0035ADE6B2